MVFIVAVQDRGQRYIANLAQALYTTRFNLTYFPLLSLSKVLIPHDLKVKKSYFLLLERPQRSRFSSFKEMCSKIQMASQKAVVQI